jgi:hypothetical protein
MDNDLESQETCFDVPAMQGPRVLALLVEIDPLINLEAEEQRYQERVERFCQHMLWRRVTGEITPEYVNISVERMFTPAELIDEVGPEVLQNLKYKICQLYFK